MSSRNRSATHDPSEVTSRPRQGPPVSSLARGRIVGSLILLAFPLYGGGSALVTSDSDLRWWGAALVLLNCAGVVVIGLVARPVVARTHPGAAVTYLLTRVFEGLVLAVSLVLVLRDEPAAADRAYWIAMTGLGLGSVFFCWALLQARLIPRLLAVWGIAGYAILAVGGLLELSGPDVGLVLSAPGGLFEVVFGVLLVVRGFPGQAPRPA